MQTESISQPSAHGKFDFNIVAGATEVGRRIIQDQDIRVAWFDYTVAEPDDIHCTLDCIFGCSDVNTCSKPTQNYTILLISYINPNASARPEMPSVFRAKLISWPRLSGYRTVASFHYKTPIARASRFKRNNDDEEVSDEIRIRGLVCDRFRQLIPMQNRFKEDALHFTNQS